MDSSSPETVRPLLEVRGTRASSVIVQRIPPESAQLFLDWQRGITAAAAEFPGYQSTELYPPSGPHEQEWVAVIHFDNASSLRDWLESARRTEWIAKLPVEVSDYRLKTLPTGFGAWFAGLDKNGGQLPHWKMFLIVLFGLYPTAMVLTLLLWPHIEHYGLAVAMLISNAASVSFLEWLGMPLLSRWLGPWLRASGKKGRALSLAGLMALLGALAIMTLLFGLAKR